MPLSVFTLLKQPLTVVETAPLLQQKSDSPAVTAQQVAGSVKSQVVAGVLEPVFIGPMPG